jgi:hypothetical protein
VKRLALIAGAVLVLVACGKPGEPVYARNATRDCLRQAGLPTTPVAATDFVAQSATGGSFHAKLAANDVTVSFGLTLEDAEGIDQAYHRFHAENVGIEDILRRQGNAVMLWKVHPTDADIATITGCLKS